MASSSRLEQQLITLATRISSDVNRDILTVGRDAPDRNLYSILSRVSGDDKREILRLAKQDANGNRALGCLVGLAVGDAVGAPLEFLPVGEKGHRFDPKSFEVVGAANRFKLKPGQWTDDTAMALCMADSLLVRGKYDGSDMRVRFWNWWHRGYNNAFRKDDSRSHSIGLGSNVSHSISDIRNSHPPPRYEAYGEDSGNGSLMRLGPIPVFFHRNDELATQAAAESSLTTHPGSIAAEACEFFGFLIVQAMTCNEGGKNAAQFLNDVVLMYTKKPGAIRHRAIRQLLEANEPKGSKERCWNWRDPKGPYLLETLASRREDRHGYNGYPVRDDYFGSYALDGLAIALHSFCHTKSYLDAITKCVNFLGDADSTAAICGQIAGAYYGFSGIPKKLIERLITWDGNDIALRAALLYGLGLAMSEEQVIENMQIINGQCMPANDTHESVGKNTMCIENDEKGSRDGKGKAPDHASYAIANKMESAVLLNSASTHKMGTGPPAVKMHAVPKSDHEKSPLISLSANPMEKDAAVAKIRASPKIGAAQKAKAKTNAISRSKSGGEVSSEHQQERCKDIDQRLQFVEASDSSAEIPKTLDSSKDGVDASYFADGSQRHGLTPNSQEHADFPSEGMSALVLPPSDSPPVAPHISPTVFPTWSVNTQSEWSRQQTA